MPSAQYQLWSDIQEIIAPAIFWPRRIRQNFWTRDLPHSDRILTAAFIWINGLNPEIYYDCCELKRFFRRGSLSHRHFKQLFGYFHEGRRYRLVMACVKQTLRMARQYNKNPRKKPL